MGIVYAAYDPELDRRVALKVLRADGGGGTTDEESRLRLLREAQALARVIHPNVVAVHDVGSVGDQVFLAMEFVEGVDLGETLKPQAGGEVADWRRTLRLFVQAGRGLAAAHQAGLAHRDFKPSNVRVGADGRVRVLDFGLALGLEIPPSERDARMASPAAIEERSLLDVSLTQEGRVFGTPRYMAPEQRMGLRADARSDQFSFSVALWEALYGELPFAVGDGDLLGRMRQGPPEMTGSVPRGVARLRPLLARGMGFEPEERFPSLEALLDSLEAKALGRRRGWKPVLAAVFVLAALVLWWVKLFVPQPCQGASTRLRGVWDELRRAEISAAFQDAGDTTLIGQWQAAARILDHHAKNWRSMYTEACEATHVRQEQSPELLDLRMACLEQRRQEFRSLTDLFLQPTPELMNNAVGAVSQLGRLDLCADGDRLTSPIRPSSDDPEVVQGIARVRGDLAKSWALQAAGRFEEALESLGPTILQAEGLRYAPLRAEAAFAEAEVLKLTGNNPAAFEAYRLAVISADEGHHDDVRCRALLGLVWSTRNQNQVERASHWLDLARAAVRRLDDEPDLLMRWYQAAAQVALAKREAQPAIANAGRAVELSVEVLGPEHLNTAVYLSTLATARSLGAQYHEALQAARRSAEIQRKNLGELDPRLAYIEHNVAIQESQLGLLEEARVRLLDAIELGQGARDRPAVRALTDLASVEARLGLEMDAMDHLRLAFEVEEELSGAGSVEVARVLNYFGDALLELRDPGGAEPYLLRALEILDAAVELPERQRFPVLFNLAQVGIRLGRPAEARGLIQRARASLRKNDPWSWYVDRAEGLVELAEGHAQRAVELLAGVAEKLSSGDRSSPLERSSVQLELARALAAAGDGLAARKEAEIARRLFLELGRSGRRGLVETESWLAVHPATEMSR
jgi:tetratricopeptide (TPR) repeat protein